MNKKYIQLAQFTQKIKTTYLKGVKPEEFIKTLQEKSVNVVVDIRDWYVYPRYYNSLNLRLLLDIHNFECLQLHRLGNPKVLRDRYKNNPILAKEYYLKYINQDEKAREQLLELFKLLRLDKNYCLICYCPVFDPKLCHRFWLKEMLINLKRKQLGLDSNYEMNYKPKQLVPEVSES